MHYDFIKFLKNYHRLVYDTCLETDITDYTDSGGGEVIIKKVFEWDKWIEIDRTFKKEIYKDFFDSRKLLFEHEIENKQHQKL